METLPEYINISRTISYNVESLVEVMKNAGEEDISIETIIEYIEDDVREDMCSPLSRHDLTWMDENGVEL
jgi:hypothetical protein